MQHTQSITQNIAHTKRSHTHTYTHTHTHTHTLTHKHTHTNAARTNDHTHNWSTKYTHTLKDEHVQVTHRANTHTHTIRARKITHTHSRTHTHHIDTHMHTLSDWRARRLWARQRHQATPRHERCCEHPGGCVNVAFVGLKYEKWGLQYRPLLIIFSLFQGAMFVDKVGVQMSLSSAWNMRIGISTPAHSFLIIPGDSRRWGLLTKWVCKCRFRRLEIWGLKAFSALFCHYSKGWNLLT